MTNDIYEEKLYSKWMSLVLGSVTTIFFILGGYEILAGIEWDEPLPVWFWPVMALLFLGLTINFLKLTIKMDHDGLKVGYGLLKSKVSWHEIEDSYLDETSTLWYGGWGVRLGRGGGNWRTVYNVIGGPRVVISLKDGLIREIVFSTKNPERVIKTIERHAM